ncbi:hypothetical protein [Nocardioides sp.]|uniref:hypothetical protein n=1 Tax=Nocardioides sp. TaxID=35761 RepID=UPI002735A4BE|nr:hypothetical protein [Nocardioides sp.]MDP3894773.1 hypothetical protein [Nocardioides sp.]
MNTTSQHANGSNLTPCAVVVDTRNVKGMLGDMFGSTSTKATGRGIRDAMRLYGFEAVEMYAGVATSTPDTKQVSSKVENMLKTNCTYRDQLRRSGVEVLEGFLVERGPKIDEKQVDVLLALQVADIVDRMQRGESKALCIVVLSEDMDLIPAYEYAAKRDVQVYAVADDTLPFRKEQKKWLLLHEAAARALGEEDEAYGSPMRGYLARLALGTTTRSGLPTKWKSRWDQRPGDVDLFNNKGVRGSIYSTTALMRGETMDLYATQIRFSEDGPSFPQVGLATTPPVPGPMSGVNEATVTAWSTYTKVRATFANDTHCSVTVTPGSVLVGDKIAVCTVQTNTGRAHYYIGPLAALNLPSGWSPSTAISTATIDSDHDNTFWDAHLDDGTEVQVQATWLEHAGVGDRLAVALAGVSPTTGHLQTMPLSCCLP